MADGGVKNRAKLFEHISSDSTAASPVRKPVVANKPKTLAKPDAAPTGKEPVETNPFKKFGANNSAQDGGPSASVPKFRGGMKSTFPAKSPTNDNSPDSNNNKSETSKEKDSKEDGPLKKVLLPPKFPKNFPNSEGGEKPAPKPKFPTPGSKPLITEKPKPQTPAKVPLLPKTELTKSDGNKTDSICSTSSNTSNSSNSSSSPSANNATKEKGHFDFSKNLRPVLPNGLPPKRTFLNSVGGEGTSDSPKSESDPSSPSPSPVPKAALPLPTSPKSKLQQKNEPENTAVPKPDINLIDKRSRLKSRGRSVEKEEEDEDALLVLRESDGKKFRKMTLEKTGHSPTAPEKPTLPTDIDLSSLSKDYEKAVMQLKGSATSSSDQKEKESKVIEEEEDEDEDLIYDQAESEPAMRPKKDEPAGPRTSDRVSIIAPMSAEEEEGAYDDTPEELYTIAETERLEEPSETEQEKKKRKKEEERERKEKEKQEREQEKQRRKKEEEKEKQRKKQEEEETKRKKNFKITGKEQPVGEGEIKDDAKGGNLNLKVRKGQKVTIVRIDNNPANKWLVKTDTHMGYVDSTNISVDPDIIRQAMTRDRKESALEEEDDQPTYDAVPEDTSGGGSSCVVEEEEYEDVYEEF